MTAIGRFFTQQDATGIGKDPYAVISYDYRQRRFDGSTEVIGQIILTVKENLQETLVAVDSASWLASPQAKHDLR